MDQRQPESCGNQRGRGIRRSGFRVHVLQEAHRHAHNSATISTGEWHLLAADSDQVYAFTRTNGDDTILVVVNLTDRSAALPSDVAELLSDGVSDPQVLLSTYDAMHSVKSIARGELARWEGVVIQL